jgi:hypothetical protein
MQVTLRLSVTEFLCLLGLSPERSHRIPAKQDLGKFKTAKSGKIWQFVLYKNSKRDNRLAKFKSQSAKQVEIFQNIMIKDIVSSL